jgi:hypothetical protein
MPPPPPLDLTTINTYLNANVPATTPGSPPATILSFLNQHCPSITGTDLQRICDCLAFANLDLNSISQVTSCNVKGDQWWRLATTNAWQRGVKGRPAAGEWEPWHLAGFHATTCVDAISIIKSRMVKT